MTRMPRGTRRQAPPRGRPGLRARVTITFALGAFLLSAIVTVVSYQLTARHLLAERERTAVRAAYFDAAVVRQGLTDSDPDVVTVLRALDTGQNRRPLVRRDGEWFARSADEGLTTAVPTALQTMVDDDQPAVQRIRIAGQPALVVGVPLSHAGEDFYEVQSLSEVQSTLRTMSGTLAAVAVIATLAAAGISRLVSRTALRPLGDVVAAAQRVSAGDLSARIAGSHDPDLDALRATFNNMVADVASRMERDRQFAADVSHELRSPLQTLTAAATVLEQRSAQLDPASAAAALMVSEESERFTQLVQDLLVLARSDAPPDLALTEIEPLLHRACERTGSDPALISCEPPQLTWNLDPVRIERALVNLLDNARHHGGGAVAVSAAAVGDQLRLVVDDQGPGVPPDERDLVLQRFARGRAAHSRGDSSGSGLGLAIVCQHAAAHGGTLSILDRPGGGGRFVLTLPVPREVGA